MVSCKDDESSRKRGETDMRGRSKFVRLSNDAISIKTQM